MKTREEWMMSLIDELAPRYVKQSGTTRPKVRVSIGRTTKKNFIGECWHASLSGDKTREIFIRPDQHDPLAVAGILAHELVHAFLPPEAMHGAEFKALGLAVGLEGKPTAMGPGEELAKELKAICKKLGAFPHAKLTMVNGLVKKQTTRLLKASCVSTGYTVRVTAKWVLIGAPICPCCNQPMEMEE